MLIPLQIMQRKAAALVPVRIRPLLTEATAVLTPQAQDTAREAPISRRAAVPLLIETQAEKEEEQQKE